jgi:Acetyltransferases, including N-acetylases of ribosomal proteins
MNIEGEKVILRAIEAKDNELLQSIINNPEIENALGGWSFPVSAQNQLDWFGSQKYDDRLLRCIIELKENKQAIGVVILSDIDYKNGTAEIHIKLDSGDFRKKGYGTDAIKALLHYAFYELRLNLVYARVNSNNLPSQKLFEKCGLLLEGTLRSRIFKQGKFVDVLSYSITRDEEA